MLSRISTSTSAASRTSATRSSRSPTSRRKRSRKSTRRSTTRRQANCSYTERAAKGRPLRFRNTGVLCWRLLVGDAPRHVAGVIRPVRTARPAASRHDDVDQALVLDTWILAVADPDSRGGAGAGRTAGLPLMERKLADPTARVRAGRRRASRRGDAARVGAVAVRRHSVLAQANREVDVVHAAG